MHSKESIMSLLYISILVVSGSLSENYILIGITLSCVLLVLQMSLCRLHEQHNCLVELYIRTESAPFSCFDSEFELKAPIVK